MGAEEALKRIPRGDFLRLTGADVQLPGDRKSALIRKGNELFNQGKIDMARRIFLTTRYTDGLIRLGNFYMKERQPLEALRMYWIAPHARRREALVEKTALVLRRWLKEAQ
jgi:hypothetical protein